MKRLFSTVAFLKNKALFQKHMFAARNHMLRTKERNLTESYTNIEQAGKDHNSNEHKSAVNRAFPRATLFYQGHQTKIYSVREDCANSPDIIMNYLED
jgi:hypothetical protein